MFVSMGRDGKSTNKQVNMITGIIRAYAGNLQDWWELYLRELEIPSKGDALSGSEKWERVSHIKKSPFKYLENENCGQRHE